MLEKIILRWKFLLDQFEDSAKAVLAKELVKIMPAKPDFETDWRMNDDYYEPDDVYIFHYSIRVRPVYHSKEIESVDLLEYFSVLFKNMPLKDLKRLNKTFESMATEIEPPYKLANAPLPCFDIGQENGIMMFKIKGKWAEDRYEETENSHYRTK